MGTIYIVTSGAYSSYQIHAVFDNKEQAEKIANHSGSDAQVEEYELNPEYIDYGARGYSHFKVGMLKDGDLWSIRTIEDSLVMQADPILEKEDGTLDTARASIGEFKEALWVTLIAKDETHAIKATNEKRIQLLAENRWKPYECV